MNSVGKIFKMYYGCFQNNCSRNIFFKRAAKLQLFFQKIICLTINVQLFIFPLKYVCEFWITDRTFGALFSCNRNLP